MTLRVAFFFVSLTLKCFFTSYSCLLLTKWHFADFRFLLFFIWEESSFYHKLWFLNLYIFASWCRIESNYLSLKYQRFTQPCWKDVGIKNLSLWQRLNYFILNQISRRKKNLKSFFWRNIFIVLILGDLCSNEKY